MINKRRKSSLIKRVTYAGMAVIMSAVLLFSGNGSSFAYASAQDVSYEFDHARTAVAQLEDLFTTIDIMDATVASLSDEMDVTAAESKATYDEIRDWVQDNYGFHVTNLNIAQVKRKYGLPMRECSHKSKDKDYVPQVVSVEQEQMIVEALKHFKAIE